MGLRPVNGVLATVSSWQGSRHRPRYTGDPRPGFMNAGEHLICSSSLWRHLTARRLLPWLLSGVELGDHLLEIGAGYGAATAELQTRASRITALEYNCSAVNRLARQFRNRGIGIVRGNASQLPFPDQTFSSALAILVLHHLRTSELQDQVFAEAFRVLRSGGIFVCFEISHHWLHRIAHVGSIYAPVDPASVFPRLSAAGYSDVSLDTRRGGFRFKAVRP